MISLRIAPLAQDDLDRIWDFAAADKPMAATRLLQRLHDRFALLSDHPELGENRDDLRPGVRSFTAGAYVVYYRLHSGSLEIVRVLHAARDVRGLL